MSITQTVEIPVNHKLTIDVPPEVPAGLAEIRFFPAVKERMSEEQEMELINHNAERLNREAMDVLSYQPDNNGKLRLSKQELDEMLQNAQTPISDSLTGILAHLGDITIEQIREERLAKYLK